LRDIWKSEAQHFTPWLAENENLALLGETIGLDLELEAVEKDVGPFRADILCKETANNSWVLVENQVERTDHTHLGQILTYAAGLNAVSIVWIAQRFTDEHRAALDWLNEITGDEISFFGLEVELWRIGTSPIAPKFNIVSKPNEWTKGKTGGGSAPRERLTEAKATQLSFWEGFREYAADHAKHFRTTKPLPQHWMNIAVGRTGFKLNAIASMYDNARDSYGSHEIRAELILYSQNAKGFYAALLAMKDELEREMGIAFEWRNPANTNMCRISVRHDADLSNSSQRPQLYAWLVDNLDRMHAVFAPRVRNLKPLSIENSEEE